ncbi:MAG: SUMF1/EgtB/PvdO family nonheme iron enzyme [Planctomycetota bacterium JB042]
MTADVVKVFLSYTGLDLAEHAQVAARAVLAREWLPIDHSFWAGSGRPSLSQCVERVRECQVLVVLVAYRYGTIPTVAQGGDGARSFVEHEVEAAREAGLPVVPLLVDPNAPWIPGWIERFEDPSAEEAFERFKASLAETVSGRFSADAASVRAPVGEALNEAAKQLASKSSPPSPSTDADPVARHVKRMADELHRVPLLGFGEQLNVELAIDELYVPLRATMKRSFAEKEEARGEAEFEEDLAVEEVFARARRLGLHGVAVLGDPGWGKTTCARRIGWECASPLHGPASLELPDGTIPVFLRLRRLTADDLEGSLRDAFAKYGATRHGGEDEARAVADALWARGRVLWLLDGLDEVADETLRGRVSAWIRDALRERPDDRFLVTCRFAGWKGDAVLGPSFLSVEVRPLDSEQQIEFVERWYRTVEARIVGPGAKAEASARERSKALLDVIHGAEFLGPRLSELAANPLLLSIVCIVHRKDVQLPRSRAALYEKCVAVLLEHWREEWRRTQGLKPFDADAARDVLEPLAWWLHQEVGRVDADVEELAAEAAERLATLSKDTGLKRDGEEFLIQVRDESGLLVAPAPGRLAFLHLTFQEYLAGCHAVDLGTAEGEALAARLADDASSWWQEVALLALARGSAAFAEAFFRRAMRPDVFQACPEVMRYAAQEARHRPAAPFVEVLREDGASRERVLYALGALEGVESAAATAAVRVLLEHEETTVVAAAADWLGEPVPASGLQEVKAAEIAGKVFQVLRVGPAELEMVEIPGGEFLMGSEDGAPAEMPVHRVEVKPFLLAVHPVTNEEYARFLDARPKAKKPPYWTDRRFNAPDQPVVGVSWHDAQEFCEWAELRLPSEAEWEYACRAGTATAFSSGDDEEELLEHAWILRNSGKSLLPPGTEWEVGNYDQWGCSLKSVAQKLPNAWGLFDMHGNVWEWCEDVWHNDYDGAPSDGSAWVDGASEARVLRGGSFRHPARFARSAYRDWWHPDFRNDFLGFRPARSVTP